MLVRAAKWALTVGPQVTILLVRLSIAVVQDLFSPGFFWSREGGGGGGG